MLAETQIKLLLLLATFSLPPLHAAAATPQPPNIALFVIDDYGHTDIGYHNREYDNLLRTPYLDNLSATGIRLEQYYVQPICTPTRSVLLSGRYQIHTGLQHGVIHPEQPYGLPPSIPLLSNHLNALGYVSHKVGKWHLGFYTNSSCPWNRGFGTHEGGSDFGYLGGMEDYWTHFRAPGYDFRNNGEPDHTVATKKNGDPTKYSTRLFRDRAIAIVKNHSSNAQSRDKPLFLYMPFQAVHSPLESAPYWQNQFTLSDFKGDKNRFTLAAMVLEMDQAVEKVVEAFKTAGMYDSSVFILSTDNGGILPGGYNWPLRGQKATWWEGGMRGVGFIHSPLLTKTNFSYHGLVHVSDWLPSLVNLAGGKASDIPGLDGHDVWDAVISNGTSPRVELLHNIDNCPSVIRSSGSPYGTAALRVGDFKLLVGSPGKMDGHYSPPGCDTATVCVPPATPSRKECSATAGKQNHVWLYDIARDPLELCNLAESQPQQVTKMMARLAEYNATSLACLGDTPNDPASIPKNTSSDTPGSWGPWRPDTDAS